jgi:hypothetical protein
MIIRTCTRNGYGKHWRQRLGVTIITFFLASGGGGGGAGDAGDLLGRGASRATHDVRLQLRILAGSVFRQ